MAPERALPAILIRADAGPGIGNGHVMRCLALGQAARGRGGRVAFLGRVGTRALETRLEDEGFECRYLADIHPHPSDLEETLAALPRLKREAADPWLVLDGYQFDPGYQRSVRSAGWPLLVVDDAADRAAYPATILLNQNLGSERFEYRTDPDTEILAGVRHAMLRKQFLLWKGWRRGFPGEARRLLITLGGGDPQNVTRTVLEAIAPLRDLALEVRVAVGSNNPHLASLEEAAAGLRFPVRLERDVEDMPGLIAWADLAISAAGSTSWELAFLGLPALLLILAENQERIAWELDQAGAAMNLGWFHGVGPERMRQAVAGLMADRDRWAAMSGRGQELVDGEGAGRVLDAMARSSTRNRERGTRCAS